MIAVDWVLNNHNCLDNGSVMVSDCLGGTGGHCTLTDIAVACKTG
jgi:hypothetical protein